MSWIAAAVIGSSVVGGVVQSKSASKAAAAQTQASEAGIEGQLEATRLSVREQRRQFDAAKELLAPYVQAGEGALAGLAPYAEVGTQGLSAQLDLAGLSGPDAQRRAIQQIEQGPEFQALTQAGEEAMLQQASATGGLRGGNTQAALAQFRPQVLSSLINQQYSRLGGFTNLGLSTTQDVFARGQAAAAGQAAAGQQFGSEISGLYGTQAANIGNLTGQIGAAQAGSALAQGQAFGNALGSIGQYAGGVSAGIFPNPFGGGSSLAPTTSLRPQARPF